MLSAVFFVLYLSVGTSAQTWCGKHYLESSPPVPPGGEFLTPTSSEMPLLAFRCSPAIRPYLAEDATSSTSHRPGEVSLLIDTAITFSQIANAAPITLPPGHAQHSLFVSVTVNGKNLASGTVPLNATRYTIPFSLSSLKPQAQAYNISCSATFVSSSRTFQAFGSLSYLPEPPPEIGSVTKMDLRTGAVLARPADGKVGPFAPVFPVGFYTGFSDYLAKDLTIPAQLKARGRSWSAWCFCSLLLSNISPPLFRFIVVRQNSLKSIAKVERVPQVHPIPSFDNLTSLDLSTLFWTRSKKQVFIWCTTWGGQFLILNRIQLAFHSEKEDIDRTYMNASEVTEQVNRVKRRPNLLVWYTADEPDGTSDPLDATLKSSNLIQSLDGGDGMGGAGYHPVSLVLNCENYFFTYVIPPNNLRTTSHLKSRLYLENTRVVRTLSCKMQQCYILHAVGHHVHERLWRLWVRHFMFSIWDWVFQFHCI